MAETGISKATPLPAPAPAAAQPEKDPTLHEIAGGWIMERKGTEVPGFLKATYVVVVFSCITYSIWWVNGDTGGERGQLVQQFNAATQFSPGFMWFVTALVVIFAAILFKFAFTRHKE
ncbi:MAG TPA: hypothetical protein VGL72_30065 [Bryobacteraceae bacterium]|jgi:hypothetical protein